MELMCDADRLWSYTHENFWLDTVRKAVAPEIYIETIAQAIDTYLFTEPGKIRARELLAERRDAVASYLRERDGDLTQPPKAPPISHQASMLTGDTL